ncbi:MAG TPA: diguanylate cyclase [Chitinivibrionales bacterium]
MNKQIQEQLDALQEKIDRQNGAIESYRRELLKVTDYKSERDLYSELSAAFALASSADEVFLKTLDALSGHLKASYYGVFFLDERKESFLYRHGKGYNPASMPTISAQGSLMGDCIYKNEVIWEPHFSERFDAVHLNQDPDEHCVLCAPITMGSGEEGILRLANIDPLIIEKARPILQTVTRLLSSSLERLKLHAQNQWTLRSLDISFAIARLLEDTLNKNDILKKVCNEVPRLFACAGCMVAMRDQTGALKQVFSLPENFVLTGNQVSCSIYLKNLLTAFPSGGGLIANIQRDDRRWAWPEAKVKSLCMAPLHLRNSVHGVLIAVGPREETYTAAHTNLLGIVAAQTSMTLQRASYLQQQEDLARCDGLTGLYNHRMFQEMLREEINRTRRYQRPLSLVMLDIDHFKKFNDTYGHPVGDEVIKMVARAIKTASRTTDRAFRYGGEEFAVILPETPCEKGIIFAQRLRQNIEQDRSVQNLATTISVGIAGLKPDETPEAFIKRTDSALYNAKETGRNRVTVF